MVHGCTARMPSIEGVGGHLLPLFRAIAIASSPNLADF